MVFNMEHNEINLTYVCITDQDCTHIFLDDFLDGNLDGIIPLNQFEVSLIF